MLFEEYKNTCLNLWTFFYSHNLFVLVSFGFKKQNFVLTIVVQRTLAKIMNER